ncbi:MAG: DUF4065 domain-containing protein [Chlamydiia bacterium]|nr:DUF4065 domain-containing protein [Chlamydiia bacterium]
MPEPVRVFDVAAYIVERFEGASPKLTAMKLQKLLYYCQAWSLVWDEAPLFSEEIQAWANGPVIKDLYEWHRGMFYIESVPGGDPGALSQDQKDTIDQVLAAYGDKTAQWLSDLTHLEGPWKDSRKGLDAGERGSHIIELSVLHEYYGSLDADTKSL